MVLSKQTRKWVRIDDQKLHELITEGAIDIFDESKENIEDIRSKHFSWCLYKNFRINFAKKIKEYKLDATLTGARGK
jgi:hypothetical protein